MDKERDGLGTFLPGIVILCSLAVGGGSIVGAIITFGEQEFIAGGVCLVAAALSFGQLANAIFRR